MKQGVWVGCLILSMGGLVCDLRAQEGAWRPTGPVPVKLAPNELKPCPAAAIGRPVPVMDEPVLAKTPLLPSTGIKPAAYHPPLFPMSAAAPTAQEIPDGDQLPTWN